MSAIDEPLELDPVAVDPFAAEFVLRAPELLADLTRAGELVASDVHVALTLGRIAGVSDVEVLRVTAMAVAAARQGHAFVELEAGEAERARASNELVGGTDGDGAHPLRLDGSRLYLDRYWREERRV